MSVDIRSLRLVRGLRQIDVARKLGISGYQIRKWERGLELPSHADLRALARLLGVNGEGLLSAQHNHCKDVTPGEGYTTARPIRREVIPASAKAPKGKSRVLDLFCGCGGLSFGFEWTDKFVTVGGIDFLPDRMESFLANHRYATGIITDARKFEAAHIDKACGPIDIIVGGPPCQGFSSIRPFRALTEGDKRNTLVELFVFLIGELKPRWFVFENVIGVLKHHNGEMLQSLIRGFEEAGYTTSWRVLNAALFGVPQNRERLVIVGNRFGLLFEWFEPTHRVNHRSMAGSREEVIRTEPLFTHRLPEAVTVMEAISDLPAVEAGTECTDYASEPKTPYQWLMRDRSNGLTLHRATRHTKKMIEIIRHAGPNITSIPRHMITSGFSSCYSRLDAERPSTTITVNFVHPASNRCIHPTQHRALTIREGARLQSFPDCFEFRGTVAQIVKQIGNAVPPLLARALGEAIYKADQSVVPRVSCEPRRSASEAS